jgi:hypothetical protein
MHHETLSVHVQIVLDATCLRTISMDEFRKAPLVHCSWNVHCHICLCSQAEHHSHLGNLRCICDVKYTAHKLVREHCSVTMCSMLGEILKEGLVHFHDEPQSNHLSPY